MKNSSYSIGNRFRDLPVCSALPQPLRHRVSPTTKTIKLLLLLLLLLNTLKMCCSSELSIVLEILMITSPHKFLFVLCN
jgi:hypothetical protein